MTREEAYQKFSEWLNLGFGHSAMLGSEVLVMAMKSLRPITREQVEKIRGEWKVSTSLNGCTYYWDYICSNCGVSGIPNQNFCERCGIPLTDKAVDILWKRLEAMQDEQAD